MERRAVKAHCSSFVVPFTLTSTTHQKKDNSYSYRITLAPFVAPDIYLEFGKKGVKR
jgi:hypothetical protein